jgi:hypothetical protein
MKYIRVVLLPASILAAVLLPDLLHAQPAGFAITQRGADWRVLSKTTVENGTNHIHQYTELATGLNYTNSYGQLVESKEQITILSTGGAAATQGRHQVYFPADIYNGVLEVITPDGRHLKSRPLGVSYDDGNNTVFIATLKHAQGYLTSSNTVTYRDAFTGFKADLVCTYRRGGFECDLVFRQQPPAPGDYGLDDMYATLQLVTEFFNTQDPQEIPAGYDDWFGLQDSTLKFGKLTMTRGKAFAFKGTNSISPRSLGGEGQGEGAIPVYKSWVHLDGRTFLIETVPLLNIADNLDALPLSASIQKPATSNLKLATNKRQFPPFHAPVADTNQILIAATDLNKQPGLVLDYNEIDSDQSDFTFQAGVTYYVSGLANLYGTTTFEGAAIIKFDGDGFLNVDESGTIVCPVTGGPPLDFTSINDDSVGEVISGSSGVPATFDALVFLWINAPDVTLRNMRFNYAEQAIQTYYDLEVWDCQFINLDYAIQAYNLSLHNVLIVQMDDNAIYLEGNYLTAENVTVSNRQAFITTDNDSIIGLTNCLVTSYLVVGGGSPVVSTQSVQAGLAGSIFQSAANANFYLAISSPYRDAGTTNINPDLLAELQTMTTYAPQDGGWPDTNTPDLGYHYPVNEDSDYDGLPDWWEWYWFGNYTQTGSGDYDGDGTSNLQEYQDGTDPTNPDSVAGLLGRWHFDTTNWFGAQGQQPLVATNLNLVASWSSNAMELNTDDGYLKYKLVEDSGHTNLNLRCGTLRFWFCPDWSSVSQGGAGPGNYPTLLEVDADSGYGYWSPYIDTDGNNVLFESYDGTDSDTLLAPISWKSNQWHQVSITYSATNSAMYVDGALVATTNGFTTLPTSVSNAFYIGNDDYLLPANGRFDELDTFDYPLTAERIAADYLVATNRDSDGNGLPDVWEFNTFGHIGTSNVISFSFSFPNQYVSTNIVSGVVTILDGVPFYYAVLVDSTNFTSATWTAYTSSNVTVNISTNQGPHDVWVGLRGLPSDAQQTWEGTTLILDSTAPAITITNPINNVSFNSSRADVSGNFRAASLKQITVNGVLAFVNGTNFDALNVPLDAGTNIVTALLEDLTGYTNIASINVIITTNTDGSLNNPVQLQATPVAGFTPLAVTFEVQTNMPGIIQQVSYDFNGDDIADFITNNLNSITITYATNGEYFPAVTIQTTAGRFSSVGGWNAVALDSSNQPIRINVQTAPTVATFASITDPVDLKWIGTNLYVLSGSSATITEFSTNGSTTRSLSGLGTNPSGFDVDAAGNVYVAETGNNQVWKFIPTNATFAADPNFGGTGFVGKSDGTVGTGSSQFNAPFDVAVSPDGGILSVSDSGNNRIQQFDTNGVFIASFGSSGSAVGQFNTPKGLTYDSTGILYIVDSGNSRIVLAQGISVEGATGTNGTALAQLGGPVNISVGERGVYVADTGNNRIQSFSPPAPHSSFSIDSSTIRFAISTNLNAPAAAAVVDSLTNEMFYVADTGNNRVILCNVPADNSETPLAVWNSMTTHVAAGDISGAISCFSVASSDNYRQAFLSVGTANTISAVNQVGTLTPVYILDDKAEYYFQQVIAGQTITFPVEFDKENGVWKILEF